MEYLHSLLKFAVNMGASDIHVKAGHHATIRISGELFPVQVDPHQKILSLFLEVGSEVAHAGIIVGFARVKQCGNSCFINVLIFECGMVNTQVMCERQ